jgi:hypothetical protein
MHPIKLTEKEIDFRNYLNSLFSEGDKLFFWENLLENTSAYIFGGVIKDFFLGEKYNHRDIDIVVDQVSKEFIKNINKFIVKRNQYGGLKLNIEGCSIDLWELEKTWAIVKEKTKKTDQKRKLPATSFFNITAITFSLKESKFILDKNFLEFLDFKKLDIVYEKNPFPELCIVKSYDFHKRYSLELSNALKDYIKKYYSSKKNKLETIQVKHFGKVIYPLSEIESFVAYLYEIDINKECQYSGNVI